MTKLCQERESNGQGNKRCSILFSYWYGKFCCCKNKRKVFMHCSRKERILLFTFNVPDYYYRKSIRLEREREREREGLSVACWSVL